MKVSTIVCAGDERDPILERLERLWSAAPDGWQVEVVVISTDGACDVLRDLEPLMTWHEGGPILYSDAEPSNDRAAPREVGGSGSGEVATFDQVG